MVSHLYESLSHEHNREFRQFVNDSSEKSSTRVILGLIKFQFVKESSIRFYTSQRFHKISSTLFSNLHAGRKILSILDFVHIPTLTPTDLKRNKMIATLFNAVRSEKSVLMTSK